MIELASAAPFAAFLIVCRVGSALMLFPGFGSARIPVFVRMALALALSVCVMPIVGPLVLERTSGISSGQRLILPAFEVVIGAGIGILSRIFIAGLQFAANIAASAMGLSGVPGSPVEDGEATSPLSTIITMGAVVLLFVLDLHIEILRALVHSYRALPPGAALPVEPVFNAMLDQLRDVFLVALRLGGPFIAYGLIVNFAIGLAGKFTPQIQVYFATTAGVTLGGLMLFMAVAGDWLAVFVDEYGRWLESLFA